MDTYDIFDSGKNFNANIETFRQIMIKAEEEANKDFLDVEQFLTKMKKCYRQLDPDQKLMLRAKDFLLGSATLLGG